MTDSNYTRNIILTKERFMSYVRIDPDTDAWMWTGGISSSGYGAFWLDGKTAGAHRAAWELFVGAIPTGMHVCHKYEALGRHNVNPCHLFVGTMADNMRDASIKHRMPHGSSNSQSKLVESEVEHIRQSQLKHVELAALYGVSSTKISQIKRGKAWLHMDSSPKEEVKIHSLRNKSGYRGVRWNKNKWEAHIVVTFHDSKKTFYLGRYDCKIEAAKAFDDAAIKYRGEKAVLNFPTGL